ncbi:MAG: hypothetical protein ACFE8B_09125 [Candidatus Hermodarchaeota archaeon]
MAQITVKKDSLSELEELHRILLEKKFKPADKVAEEFKKRNKLHEQFKGLNPKYFEEAIPLTYALDKLHTSDIKISSKYDFSRIF